MKPISYCTYGTEYLLRTAVAKYGLGGNAAEEAFYPVAMTDSNEESNSRRKLYYTRYIAICKDGLRSMTYDININLLTLERSELTFVNDDIEDSADLFVIKFLYNLLIHTMNMIQ